MITTSVTIEAMPLRPPSEPANAVRAYITDAGEDILQEYGTAAHELECR